MAGSSEQRFGCSRALVDPRLWLRRLAQDDRMAETEAGKPARILVVEDDYLASIQAEAALTEAGFEVVGVANTADAALRLASLERPELVIMDVRLAGERDGVDVALDLFRIYGIRSIFATAHYDERVRERARPAEPLGWLPKPYPMEALAALAKRCLHEVRNKNPS
jgi:DNA-binding response OmpR family regulator